MTPVRFRCTEQQEMVYSTLEQISLIENNGHYLVHFAGSFRYVDKETFDALKHKFEQLKTEKYPW